MSDNSCVDLVYPEKLELDWDPNVPWYDYQLADHGGLGLLQQYGAMNEANFEACEFIKYQFHRFGLPEPDQDLAEWCWKFAFYGFDQVDPYLFFHGISDVYKTNEALYYQFAVRHHEHEPFEEISGDSAEFFRHTPNEYQQNFYSLYNSPTLKNFDSIYDYFEDHVGHILDTMHESYYPDEVEFFRRYGKKNARDWMELGVWAAIIWMIGPDEESRNWRYSFHPIFQLVYDHGSCLLDDWTFYKPGLFIMDERPVKSCSVCGVQDWCVELTQMKNRDGFTSGYICSHCASDGEPFPGMTCGTKSCTQVGCKHHPSFSNALVVGKDRAIREIENERRYGKMIEGPGGFMHREKPGIIYMNTRIMDKYSKSIADDMGAVLSGLLSSPK